jgi:hypothetical protein
LACRHGHTAYGEEFIKLIKRCRCSAAASYGNRSAYLHSFIAGGAVEKALEKRNEGCVCGSIVNGGADYDSVAFRKFRRDFVYRIVENALAKLAAFAAGYATVHGFCSNLYGFNLNSFCGEYFFHFFKRKGSVAARAGASVKN